MAGYSVGSCTAGLVDTNELYVTTENDGLWVTTNRFAASPTFTAHKGYPFRFPSRVFLNPYDANEVWVTSFGNGLRLGRRIEPAPAVEWLAPGTNGTVRIRAQSGQRVRMLTSSDLVTWIPGGSSLVFDATVDAATLTTGAVLFVGARAD
jgi:hypothetical protein